MTVIILYEPVLHCDGRDSSEVYALGVKMINGVYYYDGIFPEPTVTRAVFEPSLEKLKNLITVAKGNHDKILERNAQSAVVFGYIKQLLIYVKPICGNEIELINKSGFDSNNPKSPHGLADKAVIKRIVRGVDPHTAKVMLAKLTGLEKHKREARTFTVYVFDSMETEEYKIGCVESDSHKLIVKNVPYLIAKYYAVGIQNAAGKNELSDKIKFTLTD